MKTKFKFLIGAATLIAGAGLITPFITSCSKNTTSSTNSGDNNNSNNNQDQNFNQEFQDNTQTYVNKIQNPNITKFNPITEVPTWADFNELSNDPNNDMYDSIYNSINKDTINNDINNMIKTLGQLSNYNFGFKTNIKNIQINFFESNWDITIEFEVYNNLTKNNTYKIGNLDQIEFESKSKKDIKLNLNGQLKRYFYKPIISTNKSTAYFGYYFPNGTLSIDNKEYKINNFKFLDYSLSLNKYIEINDLEVGYNDIADFANQKVLELTNEQKETEILNTYNFYTNSIEKILEPLQSLLQNLILTKNNQITLIEFLKENSKNIAKVVQTIYDITTKDDSLNIQEPIEIILSDKKLSEIIINEHIKSIIINLIDKFAPSLTNTIKSLLNGVNVDNANEVTEQLIYLLEIMIPEVLPELKNEDFSQLFDDLKNKGLLSTILDNKQELIKIISTIPNIKNNELAVLILNLLETININQTNVFDGLITIIKYKNNNDEYLLKEILSNVIQNETLISLLTQLIFDNPNLNADNLVEVLDIIANPRDSKNGEIVSWKEWYDAIKKTYNFITNNENNISLTTKFEFGKDIYFNIGKLYKLLPNNLTIGNITIPISTVSIALPDWLSINSGDYIETTQNFNNFEYDVVKINNDYKLSWQSFTNTTIDINMPQSLKTIYNSSLGAGSTLVSVLNNIFYSKYNSSNYFKPINSSLNIHKIENYNPNSKNNEAIFIKNISDDQLTEIKNNIENSIVENKIDGSEYIINKGIFGIGKVVANKNEISCTINPDDLLNEYVNLTWYKNKYYLSLDINRIIRSDSILGFNIPKIDIKKLALYTPYYVYSNNGEYKNYYELKI